MRQGTTITKLEAIVTSIRLAALAAIAAAVSGISASAAGTQTDAKPIDRRALVARHNIECNSLATTLPLGNGEFCFTADATGLQTFAGNAMSHWGWHSFPQKDDLRPLNLGRLRLCRGDGSAVTKKEITGVQRTLDLWNGTQTAQFEIAGQPVRVETCVDPKNDAVAVRIVSPLLARGELLVTLDFPYAWTKEGPWLGDWSQPALHTTELTRHGQRVADFARKVDDARYHVRLAWSAGAQLAAAAGAPHAFRLSSAGTNRLDFVCAFAAAPVAAEFPDVGKVFDESSRAWKTFWSTGGAIDLSASKDPRWRELERRVVLSQYLTATQSSGSWPPAETGLFGSAMWGGRFHMEMVWWHLAHFALWDRWEHAANTLGCYQRFLPGARALAEQGGHKGLEWPKCVGPEGRSSPWRGNRVLLWKEPHPIFFAELDYRRNPTRATLDKWRDVVFGTAEFMADYAKRDAKTGLYSLAPVMPPSEQGITRDTVFDLAYWRHPETSMPPSDARRQPACRWPALGRGAQESCAPAGGGWSLRPFRRVARHLHQTGMGTSRSGGRPRHVAADRGRGRGDGSPHRAQGLGNVELEPLLGLGFPLDGHGRSKGRRAAPRGRRAAQGQREEQLRRSRPQRRLQGICPAMAACYMRLPRLPPAAMALRIATPPAFPMMDRGT